MFRKLISGSLVAALMAGTASADTLREALVSAYNSNPTLTGQRETLRATDATVAIAKAAGRPQVSATVGLNRTLTQSGLLINGGKGPTVSAGVDLSVPLFTGGSVKNSVRAAETRVQAGRATLQAVEGDVFTQAVTAYMDVIRDRAIVELNQNNVRVLETNLQATQDRFQIGDLTRTDVAQSEARLQLGRSQLATAQGQLTGSEATYRQIVGHAPGVLAPPPPLPPLPATADEAVRIALTDNPDLVSVSRQAIAAGYDVNVARASRLPTLSAVGSETYVNNLAGNNAFGNRGNATAVGLSARVPIFQGGLPAARIRQAQAQQGQVLEQVVGTERAVIQATRAAFASYTAAQRAIQAETVAVQADELALEGNRAEQSVGTRTIIEVLNAEQELLNAQVALVSAKRDAYVAGFQLLNAMGQAQAQALGLDGGPLYDPLGNYRHVANNWSDWANDPRHPTIATRTVSPEELPPNPIVTPQIDNARIDASPPVIAIPASTTTTTTTTTTSTPSVTPRPH
ncbi:TolC family outer membrane protein [Sphingomonas agri]|uniref:TolC family outer membrane protein n=1 Tax=Sphingomonas agri TaxID=1813878 RepID=UPI00311E7DB2